MTKPDAFIWWDTRASMSGWVYCLRATPTVVQGSFDVLDSLFEQLRGAAGETVTVRFISDHEEALDGA